MSGTPDEVVHTIGRLLIRLNMGFEQTLEVRHHLALKKLLEENHLILTGGKTLTVDGSLQVVGEVSAQCIANLLVMMEKVGWSLQRKSA